MTVNKKHALVMLACCLIPLVALAAIFVFKMPANSVIYLGVVLLCPVLHLLMMRNMLSGDHAGHARPNPPAKIQPPQVTTGQSKE